MPQSSAYSWSLDCGKHEDGFVGKHNENEIAETFDDAQTNTGSTRFYYGHCIAAILPTDTTGARNLQQYLRDRTVTPMLYLSLSFCRAKQDSTS